MEPTDEPHGGQNKQDADTPTSTAPDAARMLQSMYNPGTPLGQRGDRTTTQWLNSQTCGWAPAGVSGSVTCDPPYTCATNAHNIVDCASDTSMPAEFATTCIDNPDNTEKITSVPLPGTAFCVDGDLTVCGILLFPGNPPPSTFRCYSSFTVISLLSVPSDIAATTTAKSPSTASKKTSARAQSGSLPPPASPAEPTSPSSPASPTAHSPLTTSKANSTALPTEPGTSIAGAVAGGFIGGLALLMLIPLLWWVFKRRRDRDPAAWDQQTTSYHGGGPPDATTSDRDIPNTQATGSTRPRGRGRGPREPRPEEMYAPSQVGSQADQVPIPMQTYRPYRPPAEGSQDGAASGSRPRPRTPVAEMEAGGFGLGSVYAENRDGTGESWRMGQAAWDKPSPGPSGDAKGKGKSNLAAYYHARVSDASESSQYSDSPEARGRPRKK